MSHLFKSLWHNPWSEVSQETRDTVEMMTTTFTNFAASGDPSAPALGINWPAVKSEDELLVGLNIHETDSKVTVMPESLRMGVFTEIWDTERPKKEPKST
jgi:carboxylesterase type B